MSRVEPIGFATNLWRLFFTKTYQIFLMRFWCVFDAFLIRCDAFDADLWCFRYKLRFHPCTFVNWNVFDAFLILFDAFDTYLRWLRYKLRFYPCTFVNNNLHIAVLIVWTLRQQDTYLRWLRYKLRFYPCTFVNNIKHIAVLIVWTLRQQGDTHRFAIRQKYVHAVQVEIVVHVSLHSCKPCWPFLIQDLEPLAFNNDGRWPTRILLVDQQTLYPSICSEPLTFTPIEVTLLDDAVVILERFAVWDRAEGSIVDCCSVYSPCSAIHVPQLARPYSCDHPGLVFVSQRCGSR